MPRDGTKNLIPITKRSKEEAKKISSKGGKKSVETRRQQKTFKMLFKSALASQVADKELKERLKEVGIEDTYKGAMMLAMIEKSMAGDVNAFKLVSEMIDEKKEESVEITVNVGEEIKNKIKKMEEEYLRKAGE